MKNTKMSVCHWDNFYNFYTYKCISTVPLTFRHNRMLLLNNSTLLLNNRTLYVYRSVTTTSLYFNCCIPVLLSRMMMLNFKIKQLYSKNTTCIVRRNYGKSLKDTYLLSVVVPMLFDRCRLVEILEYYLRGIFVSWCHDATSAFCREDLVSATILLLPSKGRI